MKFVRYCAVVVIAALFSSCAAQSANVHEIKTAQDLKAKMDAKEVMVVHALDHEHFAKGHIPGAVNIDYEKMTPAMLPANKEQPLVFYCTGGMCPVGKNAAVKASQWGYKNVWVYEGGIKDWRNCGMTVATGD